MDSPSSTAQLRKFLQDHIKDAVPAGQWTEQVRLRRALDIVNSSGPSAQNPTLRAQLVQTHKVLTLSQAATPVRKTVLAAQVDSSICRRLI